MITLYTYSSSWSSSTTKQHHQQYHQQHHHRHFLPLPHNTTIRFIFLMSLFLNLHTTLIIMYFFSSKIKKHIDLNLFFFPSISSINKWFIRHDIYSRMFLQLNLVISILHLVIDWSMLLHKFQLLSWLLLNYHQPSMIWIYNLINFWFDLFLYLIYHLIFTNFLISNADHLRSRVNSASNSGYPETSGSSIGGLFEF